MNMFDLPGNGLSLLSGSGKSWFRGQVKNIALIRLVQSARYALSEYQGNEPKVTELRKKLEEIFSEWKLNYGNQSSVGDYKDMTIEECPPYVCAGYQATDYADLLRKLREEVYPPLLTLDNEIGYQCVSALLVLSEAVECRIESAVKAHWEIEHYEQEQQAKDRNISIMMQEKALPLIEIGHRSKEGYKNREDWQDKKDCQDIAKALWEKNPNMTIVALEKTPKLKAYKRKYPGRNTLRKWLSEIDPRPKEKKTGRPKKSN